MSAADCIHCMIVDRLSAINVERGSIDVLAEINLIMQAVGECIRWGDKGLSKPDRMAIIREAFLLLAKHVGVEAQLLTAALGASDPQPTKH